MVLTLTGREVIDIVIMTVASAYIFMDAFPQARSRIEDPVQAWLVSESKKRKFLDAIILVSIPILLHEAGHKIVASLFGLSATFHASYTFLTLGIFLKLVSFPFMILVPAYVTILGAATPVQQALISFAGPAVHLAFFLAAVALSRFANLTDRQNQLVRYTKFINGFLFIFNMLPIPLFDGGKFFSALISLI